MLNRLSVVSQQTIFTGILTICLSTMSTSPVKSQILPEVWATIGSADDTISYGAGARWSSIGIEVGTGENGATGADFLSFINLPIVSPYVGIGYYSEGEDLALSGGLHLKLGRRLTIGGGYHSVRGANGKLGFRF